VSLIIRDLAKADLEATSRLAAMLVRQHHAFDPDRFMLVEPIEEGYRWFLGTQLGRPEGLLLVAELDGAIAGYLYGAVEERDPVGLRFRRSGGFTPSLAKDAAPDSWLTMWKNCLGVICSVRSRYGANPGLIDMDQAAQHGGRGGGRGRHD
jgi:hypothetical protein